MGDKVEAWTCRAFPVASAFRRISCRDFAGAFLDPNPGPSTRFVHLPVPMPYLTFQTLSERSSRKLCPLQTPRGLPPSFLASALAVLHGTFPLDSLLAFLQRTCLLSLSETKQVPLHPLHWASGTLLTSPLHLSGPFLHSFLTFMHLHPPNFLATPLHCPAFLSAPSLDLRFLSCCKQAPQILELLSLRCTLPACPLCCLRSIGAAHKDLKT